MTLYFVKTILVFSIPKCIFSSFKNITNMFSDATTFQNRLSCLGYSFFTIFQTSKNVLEFYSISVRGIFPILICYNYLL